MPETRLEMYAADLHQDVLFRAGDAAKLRLREEAFTELVLERLAEHDTVDRPDPCYHEAPALGRLAAVKLNAYALSGDHATLDLFITCYHGEGTPVDVGVPEVRRQFKLLRSFLQRAIDGHHTKIEEACDGFAAMFAIYEAREALTTVRMFLLTDGVVRSLELDQEPLAGLSVEMKCEVWDLDRLSMLRADVRQVIELDLVNDYGGAIPCLVTADPTGEYRTYLAFLPASLLVKIYGSYGQRLLERNVRAFLQAKGKVNRGLQRTLKDEPARFLAYNNGLCCTAAKVRVQGGQHGHAMIEWLSDFQIVNGGQTTASLHHAVKKERRPVDQVTVQMKLTVLEQAEAIGEIVPLISQYANSQNKVNTADFSANGLFHRRLEELSRTVWALATDGQERGTHWYYERARGSYADDLARETTAARRTAWKATNPLHQKFTKTDLAKIEHAWLGLPHLACRGAEKAFVELATRMEDVGEPEVDLLYFHAVVAKTILWRKAEKLFDVLGLQGYRANSVAYAIAWMACVSQRRLDLARIYAEQRLTEHTQMVLQMACGEAHKFLTSYEGNVGEWSKKEEAWKAFWQRELPLDLEWQSEWTAAAYEPAMSQADALAQSWDELRQSFLADARTIEAIERYVGQSWGMPTRRTHAVSRYANATFGELRKERGMTVKRIRDLMTMLSNAPLAGT